MQVSRSTILYKTITIFASVQVKTGLKVTGMYVAFTLWMHMHERNIESFFFSICHSVALQSLLVPTLCAQSPHEQRQTCLNATYHTSFTVNTSNFIIGNQNWQCQVFSHRLTSFYAYLFHVLTWNIYLRNVWRIFTFFVRLILGLDFSGSPYDCLKKSLSMWD